MARWLPGGVGFAAIGAEHGDDHYAATDRATEVAVRLPARPACGLYDVVERCSAVPAQEFDDRCALRLGWPKGSAEVREPFVEKNAGFVGGLGFVLGWRRRWGNWPAQPQVPGAGGATAASANSAALGRGLIEKAAVRERHRMTIIDRVQQPDQAKCGGLIVFVAM